MYTNVPPCKEHEGLGAGNPSRGGGAVPMAVAAAVA
jgi:hypothetical protein